MELCITKSMYFPPVSEMNKILAAKEIWIDGGELYYKGSPRNRCYIASPQGRLRLTVPVRHGKQKDTRTKDIRISYTEPWRRTHWRSIENNYRNSPYFEFFEEEIKVIFCQQFDYLIELNCFILEQLMKIGRLKDKKLTVQTEIENRKPAISRKNIESSSPVYPQVFQEKTGFMEDLSFLDCLFNLGPEAYDV